MKRRVAGILEFIGRTQVEMASAVAGAGAGAGTGGSTPPLPMGSGPVKGADAEAGGMQMAFVKGLMAGLGELAGGVDGIGGNGNGGGNGGNGGSEEGREFGELTSAEMMDVLTRRLVRWQQEYGKWGER